jgi:RNA 3'-terminal phosphate cyclase
MDRFAADQTVPFMVLASGDSVFRVASVTDHLRTAAWLASLFGAAEDMAGTRIVIHGNGPIEVGPSAPAEQ